MKVSAPAKVNLRLRVLAREDDGYHQLETVFCAIELHDVLTLHATGDGIDLRVTGAGLGDPQSNLAWRAAEAYFAALGGKPALRIELVKHIPVGAGLGGGSSDAAAVLAGLDRMHDHALGRESLMQLGAALGSDVAFFLGESPLALAWGRGERMLALPPLPGRPVLVVAPDFPIATPAAYAALDVWHARTPRARGAGAFALEQLSGWDGVRALAVNDFEPPLFELHPVLREWRDALAAEGASPALLSGSGSALFGVFEDAAQARAAQQKLQRRTGGRVILTHTVGVERPAGTG